jgi:hypothetical protein
MTEVPKSEQSLDSRLDEALEMTFLASDPIAVHSLDRRPTRAPHTLDRPVTPTNPGLQHLTCSSKRVSAGGPIRGLPTEY